MWVSVTTPREYPSHIHKLLNNIKYNMLVDVTLLLTNIMYLSLTQPYKIGL